MILVSGSFSKKVIDNKFMFCLKYGYQCNGSFGNNYLIHSLFPGNGAVKRVVITTSVNQVNMSANSQLKAAKRIGN